MQLYTIDTGYFKLDGGAMFGVVPRSIWQKLNPPDENNMCSWAMRGLLAVDGDKVLLVDSGIGNKQSEKFFGFYSLHGEDTLEYSLKKAGFSPADVTDHLLTHLHFDHVGGSVVRNAKGQLVPTFSNAAYWSNSAHWQWATNPNPREKASFLTENIMPIAEAKQLNLLSFLEPGFAKAPRVFRDMDLFVADGHTEKQMLPIFKYKGHTVVFVADLIPSSGHISLPYIMAYDMRPLDTLKEKASLLNRAAAEGWVLMFQHDPLVECATVVRTERGVVIDQVLRLADL